MHRLPRLVGRKRAGRFKHTGIFLHDPVHAGGKKLQGLIRSKSRIGSESNQESMLFLCLICFRQLAVLSPRVLPCVCYTTSRHSRLLSKPLGLHVKQCGITSWKLHRTTSLSRVSRPEIGFLHSTVQVIHTWLLLTLHNQKCKLFYKKGNCGTEPKLHNRTVLIHFLSVRWIGVGQARDAVIDRQRESQKCKFRTSKSICMKKQ